MKIDVLANDGSPLGVTEKTIWGDSHRVGTGGAEMGILTLCAEWTKAGHEVCFYNDPWEKDASSFGQRKISDFHPADDRDVLIVLRSPNARAIPAKGLKVWFSMDQQTVGNFAEFSTFMDKIVCISQYHADYFKTRYNITNTTVIDLPIRLDDFAGLKFDRVKNRLIFTSVPARGLENMLRIYKILKQEKPEVSMTITSDYRLWGVGASNEQFRMKWMHQQDVRYLGAIPRKQLLEEQLQADLLVYPCCLLPDASINLIDGSYISAKDINMDLHHAVIGGNGSVSLIKQKFTKYFDGDAVTVNMLGEDKPLLATSEHEVFCVHRDEVKKWKRKVEYAKKCGNPIPKLLLDWKPIGELSKWDYIASPKKNLLPIDMNKISPKSYYNFEVNETTGKLYCHNVRTSSTERNDGGIPSVISLDNNAGLFFGYFLAEGSASNNAIVTFTFSKDELDWAEDVLALGKEIFDLTGKIYDKGNYLVVNFSSKPLCTLFDVMFGRSKDRKIPIDFLCASKEFKLALMKGYWRGDGSVGEYGAVLSSVSERLARQSKLIMEILNFPVSIRTEKNNTLWTLFIGGHEADIWSTFIQKKHSVLKMRNRVNSYRVELDNYWLVPIKSIEHKHYSGDVYDLGLSDDHHSFLSSNVVVHNCYDELFCISVAEAQCAGAYPVTSSIGALEKTNMGTVLNVNADNPACDRLYVDTVLELLSDRNRLEVLRTKNKFEARARFAPERVLETWEKEIFA